MDIGHLRVGLQDSVFASHASAASSGGTESDSEDGVLEEGEYYDVNKYELSSNDSGEYGGPELDAPQPWDNFPQRREFFIGTPTASDDDVAAPAEQCDRPMARTKLFVGNVQTVRRVRKRKRVVIPHRPSVQVYNIERTASDVDWKRQRSKRSGWAAKPNSAYPKDTVVMSRAHAFMRGLMLASIVAECLVPFFNMDLDKHRVLLPTSSPR